MSLEARKKGFVVLESGSVCAVVSPRGGAIVGAWRGSTPLLRPYAPGASEEFDVIKAGLFPLVPFGNRIAGNEFAFDGRTYRLAANTNRDPHYLHGDGWLGLWSTVVHSQTRLELAFRRPAAANSPYVYCATEEIVVDEGGFAVALSVTNAGKRALPFGLGCHPYFPLTPLTTLEARASGYWTEKAQFLPDKQEALPAELDFNVPRPLPAHWVNNGFEGWDGTATIRWPERELALRVTASPEFDRYFVYVPDGRFEPGFKHDYFCFEPMTHHADAHHAPDLGGLRILAPGERFSGHIRFSLSAFEHEANVLP
jgi:aldose 1-epimerase